jgi:hypothetical protein
VRWRNLGVSASFAGLALAVLWASRHLPAGIASLPGPGFFPSLLALVILGFAIVHALDRGSPALPPATGADPAEIGNPSPRHDPAWRMPVVATLALLVYLVSWEWVDFLIRTPLLTLVLMRASGSTWRSAALAAALVPLLLYAMFQLGLRVDLG